jgi:DNA end-binding protein Ku
MAARSIASLTVSFGLVSIPVKLYSATQASSGISFNLLHKPPCGSRLRQQYLCAKEEVVVPRDDMVKGFEFAKDQYVIFTPEELKELEEKGTKTVEISEFVPESAIDPVYYDKAYYLAPDKGGAKPYSLLVESMKQSQRCAVARWAARGKQYIVQLRAVEGGLVMQQLLYATEVRPMSEVEIDTTPVRDNELKLAMQLIDQISSDTFDPSQYQDDVRKRIEAAVQKKVEGEQIAVSVEPEKEGAQVIDLMEALRASLGKVTKPAAKKAAAAPEPAAEPAKPAERAEAAPQRKPPRRAAPAAPAAAAAPAKARAGRKG